ncbi:MAG: sigma-54-dependent Fis family transcriptional regulator [Gemmatimonadaceae bacterium]|nr:sigma-54-dependent Fis family transcriptional regulator [Gemmatimonadaceae bacterium]
MTIIPYDSSDQRQMARVWDTMTEGRFAPQQLRPLVRDSWQRSLHACVPADLPIAPLVLADQSLRAAQERADWVPFARRAMHDLSEAFSSGHVLSLFDGEGRMLSCDGDPHIVEGLAAINFRPGGLWTEAAVGTNGPGTALATGRPVHIVGAEHYCEAWHTWHCAAVPVLDVVGSQALGVIDISGFSRSAHPHTLQLAIALASSVREMLTAREMERRVAVLTRFAQLSGRYAQDSLIAVDRHGVVLAATDAAPAGLRPGTNTPRALREAIAQHVDTLYDHGYVGESTEVFLSLDHDIGISAMSFPIAEAGRVVGTCLLLRSGAMRRELGQHLDASPSSATARAHPLRQPQLPSREAPRVTKTVTRDTRYRLRDIVGTSPRMTEAMRLASAAAATDLPVFIHGESGTGKEVFAQAIHDASARRSRPFIAVNCAALPRELIEAELFGYVGGAFTGARRDGSPGKFRAAQGGTIFLDEVSEMPYSAQAALLRVLQEQEVSSVGSSEAHAIDVRVIAATNRDVADAVRSGQLRADLYYRLNVLSIGLPSLRDRRDDIPVLAQHFLSLAATELGRPGLSFDDGVVERLSARPWPGNVRELKNVLRRIASLAPTSLITSDLLSFADEDAVAIASASRADPSTNAPVDASERALTLHAVSVSRSMLAAARRLGINRSTLYRRLERYGIKPERMLSAADTGEGAATSGA